MKLSTEKQWHDRWGQQKKTSLYFNPCGPIFRERHKIFKKIVPTVKNGSMLEVGAYPGTYLRYFYEYFGYKPWGVEYVESCAVRATELLKKNNIPGEIIHKDFFSMNFSETPEKSGWDLIVSFGFVEHFQDSKDAIAKHIELTKPGGYVVMSVPNHAGLNGWIMKNIDFEKWKQHNKMSLVDFESAIIRAGGADIIHIGHTGHIGFWNAGVYPVLRARFNKLYPLFRAPLWMLEKVGAWCVPNNRWTSPDIVVILKKKLS